MASLGLKRIVVFFIIFLSGVVCDEVSLAQDSVITPEYLLTFASKDGIRIVISASGPVKFSSYWLDNPFRLVIEFKTKNIISRTKKEIAVNQGVIKKISSEYFADDGYNGSLKSLTFELIEKVPYKILQEADAIILDIQTPADVSVFSEGSEEIFVKNESRKTILERLDAMDTALAKASTNHSLSEVLPAAPVESSEAQRKTAGPLFWLMGLTSIFGLGGFLFWYRHELSLDKNAAIREIENLKFQIAEKNKLLEQEKTIRKMIENTSLVREKEMEQLKAEFRKKTEFLEEEAARQAKEKELLKKEIKPEQPENDLDPSTGLKVVSPSTSLRTVSLSNCEVEPVPAGLHSSKEALAVRGPAEGVSFSCEEEKLLTVEKMPEKRQCLRLDLSKDYNKTIILRIESPGMSKSIKSFANNIGLRGLCFETRRDFEEKEAVSLRLFFFGDRVPNLKIKAEIIWKKTVFPVYYYGVFFVSVDEKSKVGLTRYIESQITKG